MPLAGDQLRISSVDVPRASSITLQPLSRDIRKLSEEDQVRLLQTGVQDVYTTLTVGDHLTIEGEGGACGTGDGEATPTVCMVDANNGVLIVDVKVEESQDFEKARTAFDAAKLAYCTALEQRAVAAGAVAAAAAGRGGAAFDGGPPSDDAALLKLLEALVAAADAAEALDVNFGDLNATVGTAGVHGQTLILVNEQPAIAMRGAMRVSRGDGASSVDLRLVQGSAAMGRRWCMLAGRVKDRHGLIESYT